MTTRVRSEEARAILRVLRKGLLLLSPFVLLQFAEIFLLPIDFFTFRIWEAAVASPYRYPGAFYPNLHVTKANEHGDRYREAGEQFKKGKVVTWYTDDHGWRNRPEIERQPRYDVVALGDSNIVGSALDQRDTLTEVLGQRGGVVAYSYSIAGDHISLFFSDRYMATKSPRLLVVESKAGNWEKDNSYLFNFTERADGTLDIIDRSQELARYYDPLRNRLYERLHSRLVKQVMYHWLKAVLAADFSPPNVDATPRFKGRAASAPAMDDDGWRPINWVIANGTAVPLHGEVADALRFRATRQGAYWHTEAFRATVPDGKIIVRFDARNAVAPERHKFYIFEDGAYRHEGDVVVTDEWQSFEIPLSTRPGAKLELQIDQPGDWQWLELRDFRVDGAGLASGPPKAVQTIPLTGWTAPGQSCDAVAGPPCRQWFSKSSGDYIQSPVLDLSGARRLAIRFEGRSERGLDEFVPVYLFEGTEYRQIAQLAYGREWQPHTVVMEASGTRPVKIQLNLPKGGQALSVRNFEVMTWADDPPGPGHQ